jgi:cytochrome b involved in lipid metabolism
MHAPKSAPRITADEFNIQAKGGKRLMVLNDMVLDATKFVDYHPGGKFVININAGRDISKFFFGGYCLEGNDAGKPVPGYNHSNYAKMIAVSLCVGVYEPETIVVTAECRVDQAR